MTRLLGNENEAGISGKLKRRIVDLSLPVDASLPGVQITPAKTLSTGRLERDDAFALFPLRHPHGCAVPFCRRWHNDR